MQYTACQAEPIVRRVFFPHPRRASLMRADAWLGLGLQRPSDEELICSENTRQIVKACVASFQADSTTLRTHAYPCYHHVCILIFGLRSQL
jgi:hypothetical protein